jgi:putative ABC transport system permease protein
VVLASFAVLLLAASAFLVAVLRAARLRAQRRELILLRLIGITPGQLLALVAIEHAVLAALGGLMGTAVALAGAGPPAATALGSTAPRPGLPVLGVLGVLVVAAAAASALAARRAATTSFTKMAQASPAPTSTAAGRCLAAGLPAPVAPRRTIRFPAGEPA